ncbi:MAG: class I SAM-dependent methyltransferase [Acetobacteraceae bacterium]
MLIEPEVLARAAPPPLPTCRLCGARLNRTLLDLGRMPLATGTRQFQERDRLHRLLIRICESCLLVQVQDPVDAAPWPDPAAAPSADAAEHARRQAQSLLHRMNLGDASLVIEINRGPAALLPWFAEAGIPVLAETGGFNADTAMEIAVGAGRADLVLATNILPAVPDLFDFAAGLAALLRPKGVLVLQVPHLLPILQRVQFDAFRQDRRFYFSLGVIEQLLRSVGLRVFDAEKLPDHGGSLRVSACHPRAPHAGRPALKALRQEEAAAGLDRVDGYNGFAAEVAAAQADIRDFLANRRAAGRRIAAYGLATRGTALLNASGIGTDTIAWVADPDGTAKGRFLPGCGIPVVGPEALTQDRPSDLVILPWTRAQDLAAGLLPLRHKGTQLWALMPAIRRV